MANICKTLICSFNKYDAKKNDDMITVAWTVGKIFEIEPFFKTKTNKNVEVNVTKALRQKYFQCSSESFLNVPITLYLSFELIK